MASSAALSAAVSSASTRGLPGTARQGRRSRLPAGRQAARPQPSPRRSYGSLELVQAQITHIFQKFCAGRFGVARRFPARRSARRWRPPTFALTCLSASASIAGAGARVVLYLNGEPSGRREPPCSHGVLIGAVLFKILLVAHRLLALRIEQIDVLRGDEICLCGDRGYFSLQGKGYAGQKSSRRRALSFGTPSSVITTERL